MGTSFDAHFHKNISLPPLRLWLLKRKDKTILYDPVRKRVIRAPTKPLRIGAFVHEQSVSMLLRSSPRRYLKYMFVCDKHLDRFKDHFYVATNVRQLI